ncbi:DUF4931 domain-containing protein [Bombilactobacillus mellis]|uniref:DUF4931 domain-containing protein n=1 Tax=Bombilactobacillus mellis TaxID=1218508 RepID=UPI002246B848|nr:DUF4931 domain-containing protein [Bombilactobacillus mellis]MCX0278885.1 DUF4931 domain-containing protein [Bombilactobacillus mellis]
MQPTKNLIFHPRIAQNKPETIHHQNNYCPFCDVENLTNILAREQDRIWLVNKYRTLQDTWQTIIIESQQHNGDISNYSPKQNRQIISFAVHKWQEVIATQKYRSVLLYKNFGPLSGGSLSHPHMQIVGLQNIAVQDNVSRENVLGLTVGQNDFLTVNISTQPLIGFVEINVLLSNDSKLFELADIIQIVVRYLLNDYLRGRCNSYNLFFYKFDSQIAVKIVPRFVTSPYFVGYLIPQINDHQQMLTIRHELQQLLPADLL